MKFKFLKHTADIKFRAFGETEEEVFENAAYALINIMCKGKVKPLIKKKIKINGKDNESLLYNFLEEFLFLVETQEFLLAKIKNIKIQGNKLVCEVLGDDSRNYELHRHVKAVTYNEMFVRREKNKYICQVVVDV